MTEYDVKRLALVLAIQAEIEGMKSANAKREQRGESIEWDESSFQGKAIELRDLAYKHDHQL